VPESANILSFEHVVKRFGAAAALNDLSFEIRRGEVVALLGRNGAGKTTAIRIALGLLQADAGKIDVLGGKPGSTPVRRRLAAMPQQTGLPGALTVRELLTLFAARHAAPRPLAQVIDELGLHPVLRQRYAALSGGWRRLTQFAVAVIGDPDVLVLDEPTTGLDVDARHAFWASLRARAAAGATVVFSTHYLEEADQAADRILLLHHGALIADGTPATLKGRLHARRINCRTSLPLERLRAMAGVLEAQLKGEEAVLVSSAPEATLRALLAADEGLSGVTVLGGDLESAVLALTKGEPQP